MIDRSHRDNNVPPIENIDRKFAEYDAREKARIGAMGTDAFVKELEAY